ncbi:pyridoxal phosphate-dependent aminotransferase [Tomitella fengzijianii]|uniref:Pyridoxal phosphate-dependent aminotransferase n=1 Tax=Tomitella fengzijianii TaxID=2597660 RepID=A0A516X1J3_9ACTN|nr:pyridoxal phosphate-dependent aminotransferase [Tomitella fengzijianii]QDQ96949.1 pyridoxal phosphate-dependent aminotransferase [Tomitella fengzijianii]
MPAPAPNSTSPVPTVRRLRPYGATIFAEMTALATRYDAVNLGQGFPDTDGPPAMLDAARAAIADGLNQYAPGIGMPGLRAAVAEDRRARYELETDPDTEVLITVGATEGIAGAVLGLVEPGDEVVLIEPYYDSYSAVISLAGGVRRTVPLVPRGGGFGLDHDGLRAAVSDATRMLIVNTPHNPTGTVFDAADRAVIAEVAGKHDVLVLSDEVYEHLVYDDAAGPHVPLCAVDGLGDRTLTVSSAAKTFNVTGWKTGWVCGPAELVAAARAAKQFLSYVGGTPFQPAVELALRTEQEWIHRNRAELQTKRDFLSDALRTAGFGVHDCAGTYFLLADPRPLGYDDGARLCRAMPEQVGVAAVPMAPFTDDPGPWRHLVRFAFCKRDEVLAEGARRLSGLRG